jgi:uncharacterized protein YecE (DUF72 family)
LSRDAHPHRHPHAARFPSVESNNTFYKMPATKIMQTWASEVPDRFTFAIRAPQRTSCRPFMNKDVPLQAFVYVKDKARGPRFAELLQSLM